MGAQTSTNVNENVKKAITDMSTEALSEVLTSNTNFVQASQIQEVVYSGKITCDVTIEQNATVENTVYNEMTDEESNDFQQILENKLSDSFENLTQQQQEDLVLFQANVSVNVNKTRQETFNDLSTLISSTTQNVLNNQIRVNQQQKVTFIDAEVLCENGFLIGQNVSIKNVVENVMNSVFENIKFQSASLAQESESLNSTIQKQLGIGLDDLLMAIILPFIFIVIFIILGFFLFAWLRPNSKIRKWTIFRWVTWPAAKTTAAYGRRRLRRR